MISPTLTSLLSQRRQFGLICKKNVALKFTWKIVALFTENYPSEVLSKDQNVFKSISLISLLMPIFLSFLE